LAFSCGNTSYTFSAPNVATGGRPKISIDKVEVFHLGIKYKIPDGKINYDPIQFSFYDLTGIDLAPFYAWIAVWMRLKNPKQGLTPPQPNIWYYIS
jgi:hypothetical protein